METGSSSNVMGDPIVERCEIQDYFDGPLGGVEVFFF